MEQVSGRGVKVLVVGAGLMGAQIGCEYALGGCSVTLVARDLPAAQERVAAALDLVERQRLASAAETEGARGRIVMRRPEEALETADAPANLIVESLPEDLDLKAAALAPILERERDALLATNTSSIPISALARAVGAPERTVGTHYWNPPLLMPLVEVAAAKRTPKARLDWVTSLLEGIGKRPVPLRREVPGLLWNRLQAAVLRESLWLVEEGIATPEAIDEVMRDGLARRWRLTGPFQTVGLGGAAVFDAIAANLFPKLSDASEADSFAPHIPTARDALAQLRTCRDDALAAELRAERSETGQKK